MNDRIIYKVWEGSNYAEVEAFCGEQPLCPTCGGSGEYETEYGPRGCQACNSRCFSFIDYRGKRVYADDGDCIVRTEEGLKLVTAEVLRIVEEL